MQFLFALTLLVSSALLFWVQPMFSKMVLPLLGGSPAVWNTCLVFYQMTLLFGYLYVYLTSTRLRLRAQIMLHVGLLGSVLFCISFDFVHAPPSPNSPLLWLGRVFLSSIGLPFLLLSATAPLLQAWFGRTPHPNAENPYILYAVSNFGSLLALLSYPLLVEPFFRLPTQQWLWTMGYRVLAALLAACAGWMWFAAKTERRQAACGKNEFLHSCDNGKNEFLHSLAIRLRWLVLAFIPASLLFAVTRYITTDIAAVPLFWVLPLSLYLTTFILVFARKRLLRPEWLLTLQTYLVLPLFVVYWGELRTNIWLDFPLHLGAFFVFAMVCHGELAQRKPAPRRLPEFYVWLSLGGCLGGVFTVLLAPLLFDTISEYPLLIGLACLLRPTRRETPRWRWRLAGLGAALLLLPLGLTAQNPARAFALGTLSLLLFTAFGGAFAFHFLNTPKRVALGLGSFLLAGMLLVNTQERVLFRARNFFGTLKVMAAPKKDAYLFYHGTTLHGAQAIAAEQRREPLTYFHRQGPLGQLFRTLADRPPRAIAVFGLGVGTLAAYARTGDVLTFYELDADVAQIARETQWFSYLRDCPGRAQVVIGDARLSLAAAPDHAYALIAQDAFSSDTIPAHLLTREAFQLYQTKLAADGLLVFNITNRYLNLEPVLAELIDDSGFCGVIRRDANVTPADRAAYKYPSAWVVAAPHEADLAMLKADGRWQPLERQHGASVWTDDYSNILALFYE